LAAIGGVSMSASSVFTEEIEQLARGSESCRQPMTVPGIGPLIASAMVAAIANDAAFAKGRDFAAWLGRVPKQISTGDRTILGHISKRGNRYLRTLFMQGARVILLRPANWTRHSFGPWLTAAAKRLHHNVLATALANKLARIAWTVLAQRRNYETRVVNRGSVSASRIEEMEKRSRRRIRDLENLLAS
jgi:transposase